MKKILKYVPIALAVSLATGCASQKAATSGSSLNVAKTSVAQSTDAKQSLKFVQRIADNKVYAANILADVDFTLQMGGKKISCPAKLSMRKDECIRLQLLIPFIRTEVARIDFTPDHVLLVDRYHKEYTQASYSDVAFLSSNGISFYSLQALFWNQLMLPGTQDVKEGDLRKFSANLAAEGSVVPVTFDAGNINYRWSVDRTTADITRADITYSSQSHGSSSVFWTYSAFTAVGSKKFPTQQQFGFNTGYGGRQQSAQVTLKLSTPKTSADWDTKTEVSSKYRKIEVEDLLAKLTSLQ